ncbi:ethylbenzene dehydrogenase-related protein [Salinibius halmophilus]|uniref:ethylbenzene dehydrogenase-related protein n=1 Tax=Salinibius halmophilus TaxID=1853216 RepID=UPI000E66CD8F|nr:ethylbenzene dehydrogenase-related protein [Salinibius halmophilus]
MSIHTAKASQAWLHWLSLVLLIISFASGISIAQDDLTPLLPIPDWLRWQGNVVLYHSLAAIGWFALVPAYLVLRNKLPSTKKRRIDRSHQQLLWAIYGLTLLLAFTGLMLWWWLPARWIDWLHELAAWAFVLIIVAHSLIQFWRGKLAWIWRSFALGKPLVAVALTAVIAAILAWQLDRQLLPFLTVPKHSAAISIDGSPDEPVWQQLPTKTLSLGQGASDQQTTTLTVRAFHDGNTFYANVRWQDLEQSLEHLPLVKTEEGWQALSNGFERDDELNYYEDKMAVMLANSRASGGNSVHLGRKPLANHPESRSQRGFHYTTDGSILDVWHWKAVRGTGLGGPDDMHFGSPAKACEFCPRYKAGYQPDPKIQGGIRYNWTFFKPEGVVPRRLPDNDVPPDQLIDASLPPTLNNAAAWNWYRSHDYQPNIDELPVGSQMPSVMLVTKYDGDRGDVRGVATWQDGWWNIELARQLDTGSDYDVPIASGTAMFFAVFDHAQTRHRYHHRPVILELSQ